MGPGESSKGKETESREVLVPVVYSRPGLAEDEVDKVDEVDEVDEV